MSPRRRPVGYPGPAVGGYPKFQRKIIRTPFRNIWKRSLIISRGPWLYFALAGTPFAYKISPSDARRMENAVGKPLDQMNENEVNGCIQQLSIGTNQLAAQDVYYLADLNNKEGVDSQTFMAPSPFKAPPQDDFPKTHMNPSSRKDESRFCPHCGQRLEEKDAKFCGNCGSQL